MSASGTSTNSKHSLRDLPKSTPNLNVKHLEPHWPGNYCNNTITSDYSCGTVVRKCMSFLNYISTTDSFGKA